MSPLEIPLESIMPCLQGVIPSPFATVAADGMPNITYMSVVHYVDSDRVALSRQFLNKTAANLEENPAGQVMVVDPATIDQYVLELEYLVTETEGPTFDAMRSNLEAVSAHTGSRGVARLRGVDIHRVVACRRMSDQREPPVSRELQRDTLRSLDELVRRLSVCVDYDEAVDCALRGLDDLFGFGYSLLLARDGERLTGVAANGYSADPRAAEVEIGAGLVGVAAEHREVVSIAHLGRSLIMADAVSAGLDGTFTDARADGAGVDGAGVDGARTDRARADPSRPISLAGPRGVQSVAAVPLVANGGLLGTLYLESEQTGTFGAHRERLLRIIGAHLAGTLATLAPDRHARGPHPLSSDKQAAADALQISYYQADDSVFADKEYVIKGVPGRILWKLLREHVASGRVEFTNRELRLDEQLGLPAGNDNLDSRLVSLRRRLAAGPWGIRLERVGRGRLRLDVERPVALSEVRTDGPMRHAHAATGPAHAADESPFS